MMKLLYISAPSFADCDMPLIKALKDNGIDVTYLILLSPYELRSTLIDIKQIYPYSGLFKASVYPEIRKYENYMDMNEVYVCNRVGRSRKTWSYWKSLFALYRFIIRGRYELIHSDILFEKEYKWIYRCGTFITTIHDPFPHSGEEWNYSKSKYFNATRKSEGIVLLNEKQKDKFISLYSVPESKVLVNSLGIYDIIASQASNYNHYKGNNILFFGRIAPYKGIEYLCEAMKLVRKIIPDAKLTVAGSGKLYFDNSDFCNCGYIDFRNYYVGVEELAELLSEAAISVCPYIDATQSGVVMTSFALGVPVIVSNVGGLAEMVDNGKTGTVVEPKNSEELANAILDLLNDRKKLDYYRDNVRQLQKKGKYNWVRIAEKYIGFYNKILSKKI